MKYIILLLVLTSCYTQKKAEQQSNKALDKYPEVIANIARKSFPCITTETDSTEFNAAINQRDSAIRALGNLELNQGRLKQLVDKAKLDLAAEKNCGDVIDHLYAYADTLEKQNTKLVNLVKKLQNAPPLPPIIRKIKDSSEIFIAYKRATKAIAETADWKAKYNAENELRKEYQKRQRGKVLVPWWVFVIIAAGVVIYFRKSIKSIFMFKLIIAIACAMLLSSCGHFKDGTSIWSDFLWVVFWIPFIGSLLFLSKALVQKKGGAVKIIGGATTNEKARPYKLYELWRFKAFVVLQVFCWALVWYLNSGWNI